MPPFTRWRNGPARQNRPAVPPPLQIHPRFGRYRYLRHGVPTKAHGVRRRCRSPKLCGGQLGWPPVRDDLAQTQAYAAGNWEAVSMPFAFIPTALGLCFCLIWLFIGGMVFREGQLTAQRERELESGILPMPSHLRRRGAA